MREELYDEGHLRKYLLGELNEAEQQGLEERLLSEDELFDLLLVAEDELIDDCVGGALSAQELQRFDSFISTPERHRKLSFAMALRRYVRAEAAASEHATTDAVSAILTHRSPVVGRRSVWWKQALSSPYLRLALAAVIVISLGLGIWRTFFYQPEVAKGMAALARAYSAERPVEARISGLDYAPISNTRGGEPEKRDSTARDRAERILLDEVATNPGAAAYHAVGRLYLAEHKFDDAIVQFEKALEVDPNNARLHSDYGVALFEKARNRPTNKDQSKSIEELSKSLEQFNRALELDGNLLESIFNRALYHEYVTLRRQAVEDWRLYLEKDPVSKWSAEAKDHLRQLEEMRNSDSRSNEELLKDFIVAYGKGEDAKAWDIATQAREAITGKLIWWQLLGAFLDGTGKEERIQARAYLEALSYLGRMEVEKTGDNFVSGLATFYTQLSGSNLEPLARAHELVNQGHDLCLRSKYTDALNAYDKATEELQNAGDKWESCFADYWIGYCYQRMGNSERGRSVLERLIQTCNDNGFLWVLAQATNKLASIMADTHNLSKANEYTKEALRISELISDSYSAHKNIAQLANQYEYIDDYQLSLDYMRRCLESARVLWPGSRQMCRDYDTLAEVLSAMQLYVAAADYEKEALLVARETIQDPAAISLEYAHLGFIYEKLHNHADAIEFAQRSYETVKHLSAEPGGLNMLAYSSVQLGHIYRQAGDFDNALTCYDRAISFLTDLDNIVIYEAHKGRMLCYIARGSNDLAQEELQVVLTFSEDCRSKIFEEKNRNKFFDVEQTFYDAVIDFQYSRLHDEQGAFELSETLRARSLLDLMQTGAQVSGSPNEREIKFPYVSEPLKLDDIKKRLPANVQLLEYTVLDDKLLIWVVTKNDNYSVRRVDINWNELKERVLNYCEMVSSASGREEERLKQSKELYRILIQPVEPLLDKTRQICVIPEKALNYLPFNTLVSPGGSYLISDYCLIFSPSANIYLLCSDEAGKKGLVHGERVLSVGNPLIDHEAFPSLYDLPSAAREARKITEYYSSNCLLIEEHANKGAVKKEMPKADVIHLASHYVVDERSPMLSKLLLARDAVGRETNSETDGLLRADEIYKEKPLRARLIVLSGCQTGVERYYNGEGMIGMSRMFIAAGVPLVVASLWPVDSDSTAALMIKFHKYRKQEGLSTIEALRKAQLEMIDSPDPRYRQPSLWAPFIMIGGSASF
jgi:CHAT domain-containing protein/lipoprotein NlpI